MSACTTFEPVTLRERNKRSGRIGLRPRAWRTTNAASRTIVTAPRTAVRSETSP